MDNIPYILDETDDFAVVYKPPKMHCAPGNEQLTINNENKENYSVLEWFKKNSTSVFDLVHRLDYETHGLVLIAKNEKSFVFFKSLQDKSEFIKEYSAKVKKIEELGSNDLSGTEKLTGFPPYTAVASIEPSIKKPRIIMSYFRPFGQGRKQVRPVIDIKKSNKETAKDRGGFYRTEIISIKDDIFTMRIKRGFRHQIRCHLCWIGCPILNDPLYFYGEAPADGLTGNLALRAHALFFTDPAGGKQREYRISQI